MNIGTSTNKFPTSMPGASPTTAPTQQTRGAISIRNVTKIYDPEGVNVMAVDNCSMEIAAGEVCMIVGPSGCGKTTLLNAIAGFHSISSGEILLDGELLAVRENRLPSRALTAWWCSSTARFFRGRR